MLRFFRTASPPLTLLLALFITTSSALSSLRAPHPVSGQLAWCGQNLICWMGINTRQTTTAAARAILETQGYQPHSQDSSIYYTSSTACSVRVMPLSTNPSAIGAIGVQCEALSVSEIMNALGTPDRVGFTCDGNYIFYYGYNLILNLGSHLSPNAPVELMAFTDVIGGGYRDRWYGFALPWLYRDRFC
ncbi:MAG: hypothetical protein U0694_04500 [Anaerolineae bacterium]